MLLQRFLTREGVALLRRSVDEVLAAKDEEADEEWIVNLHQVRFRRGNNHPGVELRANFKSISQKCQLCEVAFVWKLTKETIHLPLVCL